jgi:hypothetical protein
MFVVVIEPSSLPTGNYSLEATAITFIMMALSANIIPREAAQSCYFFLRCL